MNKIPEKLADLLLRWEEAWEHGEDIPASLLCEDHPELLKDLQVKIDDLKKMAWMTKNGEDQTAEEPDDLISKTLGDRYRIESLIASGGFGRVYKAYDPELERHVAVKVPNRHQVESNGNVDALVEEARRVAKLRHPGIVTVHDVGTDNGTCFIVSDLIDGKNLADVIAEDRPTVKNSILLVAKIADNLQAAHDEGFVHRDIKPANILIDDNGNPLITDFGIATTGDDLDSGTTATSGTLPYMAPEQVAGETQLIDARTDIYSLGVVLYELLTGHSPYHARTPVALREQILFRTPQPVGSLNSSVTPAIEAVCMKCLSKHPADRYGSASGMAMALRSSLNAKSQIVSWTWPLLTILAVGVVAGTFMFGKHSGQPSNNIAQTQQSNNTFVFDGNNRIMTPLERFAPVTLEAWVRPDRYEDRCHFVIGSDVPGDYGIGMAICPTRLSAEYIGGDIESKQAVPIRTWSHITAVFGEDETRLYFNGKLIETGPSTESIGGTNFVIGNVGDTNHIDFFLGKVRSIRISEGERYDDDFTPEEQFMADGTKSAAKTLLIYEGTQTDGDRVLDLSGNDNHGTWQKFDP